MAATNGSKEKGPGHAPAHLKDLHCYTETEGIMTTTMVDIPGYRVVEVLGTVYGLTVRSRNWAVRFAMALKSIAGGELSWFTSMVSYIMLSSSYDPHGKLPLTTSATTRSFPFQGYEFAHAYEPAADI